MHKALALIGLAAMTTSGCVVYPSSGGGGGNTYEPAPNATPYINWADAGCYYDGYFNNLGNITIFWSSTEFSNDFAWGQYFIGFGNQVGSNKVSNASVRAVRTIN